MQCNTLQLPNPPPFQRMTPLLPFDGSISGICSQPENWAGKNKKELQEINLKTNIKLVQVELDLDSLGYGWEGRLN